MSEHRCVLRTYYRHPLVSSIQRPLAHWTLSTAWFTWVILRQRFALVCDLVWAGLHEPNVSHGRSSFETQGMVMSTLLHLIWLFLLNMYALISSLTQFRQQLAATISVTLPQTREKNVFGHVGFGCHFTLQVACTTAVASASQLFVQELQMTATVPLKHLSSPKLCWLSLLSLFT